MALDFPAPATPGQTYVNGGVWIYDGTKWNGAGGGGAYLPLTGGNESGRVNFAPAGPAQADLVLWKDTPPGSSSIYLHLYNDGSSHINAQGGQLYLDCSNNVWITGSANGKGLVIQNAGGNYLHIWDDGNPHFAASGGAPIWLDASVNTGFLTASDFLSNGNVNCAGIYYIQSRAVLSQDTSYTNLRSPYNNAGLLIGSPAVDATSYYRNNLHRFTAWDDSFWAEIRCGIFRGVTGRVISEGNSNPSFTCHWPGNYAAGMFLSSTYLYFGNMDGAGVPTGTNFGYFESNGKLNLFNGANVTGSVNATGDVIAGNALYTNGMYWVNNAGYMYTPWSVVSAGDVIAQSVYRRYGGRGAQIECWGTDWDAVAFTMSGGNFLFSPNLGASGYYVTPTPFSDARLKSYIRDTDVDALAAIMNTPVRAFSWNPEGISLQPHLADRPHVSIGFVAQEVEETMPSAVEPSPFDGSTLHIVDHNLTPYLVRAIQQLTARVAQLEAA